MNESYIILLVFIVLGLLLFLYGLKLYRRSFYTALEMRPNIEVVTTYDRVIYINRAGLDFFGSKSIKAFKQSYGDISRFFIEEKGCVNKHTTGKKWLTNIYNSKNRREKVKLKTPTDKNMEYYFYIQLSQMNSDRYLLSFTDITKLESDKDMIRKLADYDALTSIYSRVKFNEMFPQFIGRASQYNERFSIILFDIDHFKMINDKYGHNVGDKVLVELSAVVKNILKEQKIRKTTLFSRWGGEEFVILYQFATKQEAYKLASLLRNEMNAYLFDKVSKVTCSFGVTEFKASDNQIAIFHRVDEALYEAKANGRNQVVLK